MSISIVSEGPCEYRNYNTPRFENHYGYAQLMSGAFVIKTIKIAYLNQEILHFQQSSTDILQSIGCGVKKILNSLTPPVSADVTVYLLRQNILLYALSCVQVCWQILTLTGISLSSYVTRLCRVHHLHRVIRALPQTVATHLAAARRTRSVIHETTVRTMDRHRLETKLPPLVRPTSALMEPGRCNSAYDGSNHPYTVQFDLGITDPNAVVTVSTRNGPGGTNSAGLQDKVLQVTVNGVTSDTRASGFGMNVFNPYYSN